MPAAAPPLASPISSGSVFRLLGEEVEFLIEVIATLDTALPSAKDLDGRKDWIIGLQRLDLLAQHLSDILAIVTALSDHCSCPDGIDRQALMRDLRLDHFRSRLGAGGPGAVTETPPGDVDLF